MTDTLTLTRAEVASVMDYKDMDGMTIQKTPYRDGFITLHSGDVLETLRRLPSESVHCVVTSPPYWNLRDYGTNGQLGLEATPAEFVAKMVEVFSEVRRVLRSDGNCWVNLGDSYNGQGARSPSIQENGDLSFRAGGNAVNVSGLKPKDLCGMPWRTAFALQEAGWWLRQDIIWQKLNPMPESVTDRCTKGHEYIFLLTKAERYFYDAEAIKEEVNGNAHARVPGNKTHSGAAAYEAGDAKRRTTSGLVAYAERQRTRAAGVGPKGAAAGSGIKYNESFSSAVAELVSTRNKRSVWPIATQPFSEAHFATFPYELPETCIKAGTSEHGCCADCGKPYSRIVEKVASTESWKGSGFHTGKTATHQLDRSQKSRDRTVGNRNGEGDSTLDSGVPQTTTKGWQKQCKCETDLVVPCTVLEPFAGSGTTLIVAKKLGRRSIGVELNPEYCEMAIRRIKKETAMPLFDSE